MLVSACSGGRSRTGGRDGGELLDGSPGACVRAFDCLSPDPCVVASCDGTRCRFTPLTCLPGATCDSSTGGCTTRRACADRFECADEDPCTTNERCDSATRTCVYRLLDGDGDGSPPMICGGGDCDDSNPHVSPLTPESCNLQDDNCNGLTDEGTGLSLCGSASATCDRGSCICTGTQQLCEDWSSGITVCADVTTDSRHCGSCRSPCAAGNNCVDGLCRCPSGGTQCLGSSVCHDLTTDPSNCGRCGAICRGECSDGVCNRCGDLGEACCSAGAPTGRCFTGLCGPTGTCVSCGGTGQPCCDSGSPCTSATNTCRPDGTCGGCGGEGEPCCTGFTCDLTSLECLARTCRARSCARAAPLPAAYLPRCSAATYSCVLACTTGACIDGCYLGDTTPAVPYGTTSVNCDVCDNQHMAACLTTECPAEWAAYSCCFADRCGSVDGNRCRTSATYCRTTYAAVDVCLRSAAAASCRDATQPPRRLCFPP